jgi:D-glycero-alpha-D-manno-heptose-7-phosphate kinase
VIEARAPLRVDLAGGWTDLSPFTIHHGGEVVNFTIDKYVRARLGSSGEVEFSFDVPAGSGLGTSGALNVARIAVLNDGDIDDIQGLAEQAYQAEIASGNRCGRQDQWAAALGGFNRFMFVGDSVESMPFEAPKTARNWLRKHLLIVNSGIVHDSGEIQNAIWARYDAGEEAVTEGLLIIRAAARKMVDGLQRDHRHLVVEALDDICRGVDLLDPAIHDPFRSIIAPLMETRSVMAWKALGAGGGGCAALLCNPLGFTTVREAIDAAGWEIIEWDFEDTGLTLIES